MLCVIARMRVTPLDRACLEFEDLFADQAAKVAAEEPGTLVYQMCKPRKNQDQGAYTFIEIYQDKAALMAHVANAKRNPNKKMGKLIIGKPEIKVMPVVGSPGIKPGRPKYAVVATIPTTAANAAKLEEATGPALAAVHSTEPGTLLYALCSDPKNDAFVFAELYTDMGAIVSHGKTPHFKAMGKAQMPFVNGKPTMDILMTIGDPGHAMYPAKL